MRIQRGGGGGGGGGAGLDPHLKNCKNIGFLRKTGLDPLKNHKATKPAFNVGPPSARPLAGRCWSDFSGIWIHSLTKNTKKFSKLAPL